MRRILLKVQLGWGRYSPMKSESISALVSLLILRNAAYTGAWELRFHFPRIRGSIDRQRRSQDILEILRRARPPRCAQLLARPAGRSYAALHQRRHEPVQGRLPRRGAARLQT